MPTGKIMILGIGLVVALYVLARLTAEAKPIVGRAITLLAIVVAAIVVIDLAVRTGRPEGIKSFVTGEVANGALGLEEDRSSRKGTGPVTRASGGSITTVLGYGFAVAKESSLQREFIAVHDSVMPALLEGTPGVTTVYERGQYSGDYRYRAKFTLATRQAIQAYQVVFLTFDVWGEHVRVLTFEEVADIAANSKKEVTAEWSLYSENDVERHYASIAYVARVRLADGRVIEAPTDLVVREARKFSEKFTAAELEPKPSTAPRDSLPARGV